MHAILLSRIKTAQNRSPASFCNWFRYLVASLFMTKNRRNDSARVWRTKRIMSMVEFLRNLRGSQAHRTYHLASGRQETLPEVESENGTQQGGSVQDRPPIFGTRIRWCLHTLNAVKWWRKDEELPWQWQSSHDLASCDRYLYTNNPSSLNVHFQIRWWSELRCLWILWTSGRRHLGRLERKYGYRIQTWSDSCCQNSCWNDLFDETTALTPLIANITVPPSSYSFGGGEGLPIPVTYLARAHHVTLAISVSFLTWAAFMACCRKDRSFIIGFIMFIISFL